MQTSTQINRKHTLNDRYFDNIDTQEKAYWLGFIWADGSISKTTKRSSGPNRLRVTQKWSERNHLTTFQDTLHSDYSIVKVPHAGGHDVAQLDINCRPLCAALEQLGYGPKTIRIHVPDLCPELLPHFMRGYFDGDGGLSLYTQKIKKWTVNKQEWSITGDSVLITEIQDILSRDANVTPTVQLKPYKRSPNTKSLRYGKKNDIVLLHEYLYKNATVYLQSKHDKFIEFFSR